jgi:hypothetical protein
MTPFCRQAETGVHEELQHFSKESYMTSTQRLSKGGKNCADNGQFIEQVSTV